MHSMLEFYQGTPQNPFELLEAAPLETPLIRSSSHFFLAPPLRNRSTGWAEAEHLGYKAISAPGQYLLVIKYKA